MPMGVPVGVFDDEEVKNLSEADKRLLKEYILGQIQTSEEVRRIIRDNPRILTVDPDVRTILRQKAGTLKDRLAR
jgi:hypothetical protein